MIALGSQVRLKSGGPTMTVTSHCQHPLNGVNCMWWDDHGQRIAVVENVSTLALNDVTPPPEPTADAPKEKTP